MIDPQQPTSDQPAGKTDQSLGAKILWLKGLWALAGAALATTAGVALFYIYMWNIGGVPIAQLSSVAIFSKIIVPTALFLCVLLLAVWLTPLIVVAGLLSDRVDLSLKRLFDYTPAERVVGAAASTQQPELVQDAESLAPAGPAASESVHSRLKPPPFNLARVLGFAASTAGVASLLPVAISMMPQGIDKAQQGYWFAASGLALFLISLTCLRILWMRSGASGLEASIPKPPLERLRARLIGWIKSAPARTHRIAASSLDSTQAAATRFWKKLGARLKGGKLAFFGWLVSRPFSMLGYLLWLPFATADRVWVSLTTPRNRKPPSAPTPEKESFATVAAAGIGAGFISLMPYLLLTLILLSDETFVRDLTDLNLIFSLLVIGLSITIGFAASLAAMLTRRKEGKVQWRNVLLINAGILCGVLFGLKLQGHLLNRIMILSSVRIEHANVFLEADGCEILAAMSAVGGGVGWTPSSVRDSKACMLYNVTVQSSLDPALQIACWRTPPTSGTNASAAASTPAAASASAAHTGSPPASAPSTAASPASAASTAAPAPPQPSNFRIGSDDSTKVVELGSFSMPTKYVRNAWKIGRPIGEIVTPVCPQTYSIDRLDALASSAAKESAPKPSQAASPP